MRSTRTICVLAVVVLGVSITSGFARGQYASAQASVGVAPGYAGVLADPALGGGCAGNGGPVVGAAPLTGNCSGVAPLIGSAPAVGYGYGYQAPLLQAAPQVGYGPGYGYGYAPQRAIVVQQAPVYVQRAPVVVGHGYGYGAGIGAAAVVRAPVHGYAVGAAPVIVAAPRRGLFGLRGSRTVTKSRSVVKTR